MFAIKLKFLVQEYDEACSEFLLSILCEMPPPTYHCLSQYQDFTPWHCLEQWMISKGMSLTGSGCSPFMHNISEKWFMNIYYSIVSKSSSHNAFWFSLYCFYLNFDERQEHCTNLGNDLQTVYIYIEHLKQDLQRFKLSARY